MVSYPLLDGRTHYRPCPAAEHSGDRSGKNVTVRLMPDGGVMLRCHSHHCSYQSIAEGFGIELPSRRQGRSNDRWLIAVYDHPDGVPRKVYRRDWPRDFPESPAICVYKSQGEVCNKTNSHKHIWGGRLVKRSPPAAMGRGPPRQRPAGS